MSSIPTIDRLIPRFDHLKWKMAAAGVAVGLISGLLVVVYRLGIEYGTDCARWMYAQIRNQPWLLVPWMAAATGSALLIAWMVGKEPMAGGSGIPQTNGVVIDGLKMRWQSILPVRFVGGLLGSLFGLSLGREGPSIQIGASGAQFLSHRLRGRRREDAQEHYLVSAGAAAGLSAAFSAPLSGMLFALEGIHRSFSPTILMGATVKVRFSAQAYSEKYDGSGADAGKILVKAVRGAVLGAKGAITGTVTEVSAADPVDISAAKARFREFEATLTNVTPDCRIVISTSEKRALLDNVVVTCTAITPATKPAAPGGVSFDAAAAADRLTLKWNAVPDATSYTVAYWKGSASAPESEYAYKTGIASTATSQELTNLESNTSYWAKVKAVGSLDSDWSETANATTMDSGGEPLLPTADLLDVVFRNDGSAMDNSSSATPVRRMPSSRP